MRVPLACYLDYAEENSYDAPFYVFEVPTVQACVNSCKLRGVHQFSCCDVFTLVVLTSTKLLIVCSFVNVLAVS